MRSVRDTHALSHILGSAAVVASAGLVQEQESVPVNDKHVLGVHLRAEGAGTFCISAKHYYKDIYGKKCWAAVGLS